MKAIETTWHGIRFRSKLEARWAVIFECLGIDWEYEPEGFVLDDGTCYLPDFLLHGIVGRNGCMPKKWWDQFGPDAYADERCDAVDGDLYVEVKGRWTNKDKHKVREFARYHPIYCVGNISFNHSFGELEQEAIKNIPPNLNFETVDGEYCGAVLGVNYYGEAELFDDSTNRFGDCWRAANVLAYGVAARPRFDHGDVPDDEVIDVCRSMIAEARDGYAAVRDNVNEVLGRFTDEDKAYLSKAAEGLSDIKTRLGVRNIRVEAYNTNANESCVELVTELGTVALCGSWWYRVASSDEHGKLVFASQGEHKNGWNGAKCAALAEDNQYVSTYVNAPLLEDNYVLGSQAFVASIDK